jgi:hypothetical protein
MSSAFVAGSITSTKTYRNSGFFPDIDSQTLRQAIRLDGSVSDARLEAAIVGAMVGLNLELYGLQQSASAQGYTRLADVPAEQLNDTSRLVLLYMRALYALTAAELYERYRAYDSTPASAPRTDELSSSIDDLRRDARSAVRDLLGLSHSTVELI